MTTNSQWLWGIHAGEHGEAENLFLAHGYLAIGWKNMGNLGELPDDPEAFRARLAAVYPDEPPMAAAVNMGQLHRFVHVMKIGDLVAYRAQPLTAGVTLVFLGRVVGYYLYNPVLNARYSNVRRVEWLRSVPLSRFTPGAVAELNASMTLFQIDTHAHEFFSALQGII